MAMGFLLMALGGAGWWFGREAPRREPTGAAEEQGMVVESVAEARGVLLVSTVPVGALVSVDGGESKVAPAGFSDLGLGKHKIAVSAEGYAPREVEAEMLEDKVTEVGPIVLEAIPGMVMANRGTALASPFAGAQAGEEMENSIGMKLCWCPAGEFLMGSPPDEEGRDEDEVQHRMRFRQGVWLGKYEVTQGEWERVMGNNPSKNLAVGSRAPVETVSWEKAVAFCGRLTEIERRAGRLPMEWEYRLPTEAQWEYGCRAGTTGPYAGELDRMGWYADNSGDAIHVVGQKAANAWGLHDMHGNVWEWCLDSCENKLGEGVVTDTYRDGATDPLCYTGSSRVYRGGSRSLGAEVCRSANRYGFVPGFRSDDLGFRVAAVPVRPTR